MPQEPEEFPNKPASTSTTDLFQKEEEQKEICTCGDGETSTEFAKKVAIVEPVKKPPVLLPAIGKNFIFKPVDPEEIDNSDDNNLPSLPCDETLTISSDL